MNHSCETNKSKYIPILLVAVVIAVCADWFLSDGPPLINAGIDIAGLILGLAAATFLHRVSLKDWIAVVVFLLVIPLLIAFLAWVPQIQSGANPVFLYFIGLIVVMGWPPSR